MKTFLSFLLTIFLIFVSQKSFSQKYIVRDIKSFGARGNGKTSDHKAFQRAAVFFTQRGGNGKLIISKGIYIVGSQVYHGVNPASPAYTGEDVLYFKKVKKFAIAGTNQSIIKFRDSLKFGSFDPASGKIIDRGKNFRSNNHAAIIGNGIVLDSCSGIIITNLILDGSNKSIILGGIWGDVGRQLPHYGIFIKNSANILIEKINVHHFGLDGINVANLVSATKDNIQILNSRFEYNARQGMSWTGGNELLVKNCAFNHTGRAGFFSAPSAGLDIEAEIGPIRNGRFINCEFVNNSGVGMVADTGDEGNCIFTGCTFWGVTNWSVWVTKPGFTFNRCNIYGSFVHGYTSPDEINATKFFNCTFEDKLYKQQEPFGNFLAESNGAKRLLFSGCNFISRKKNLCWLVLDKASTVDEMYQIENCSFVLKSDSIKYTAFGLIKGAAVKNCTFQHKNEELKKKGLFFLNFGGGQNTDLGGNKIIDKSK